jgi:hypothetical protein
MGRSDLSTDVPRRIGMCIGALVGAASTLAALRLGNEALAPPLVLWGIALVAAGCCDAVSQRIPTALVRQAIVVTCVERVDRNRSRLLQGVPNAVTCVPTDAEPSVT